MTRTCFLRIFLGNWKWSIYWQLGRNVFWSSLRSSLNLQRALHSVAVNCKYYAQNICLYVGVFKGIWLRMFKKCCRNCWIHTQTHAIIENVGCIVVPQNRVLAGDISASECFSSPLCSCFSAVFLINGLEKLACSEGTKWLLINDNLVLIYKIITLISDWTSLWP